MFIAVEQKTVLDLKNKLQFPQTVLEIMAANAGHSINEEWVSMALREIGEVVLILNRLAAWDD